MAQEGMRKVPLVTLALVASNMAAAFLAPFSDVLTKFAFDPAAPTLVSALTSLFLHDPSHILHLLGNMVFLAGVGPLVESSVGAFKFLGTYLASGLVGVAVHFALSRMDGVSTPLIGASAAVAGCVGYCSVRYMKRSVLFVPKVSVPVIGVIGIWVFLQVLGTFVRFEGSGGTAFHAHIGGFLTGLALAFVFRAPKQASIEMGHARIVEMDTRSPAAAKSVAAEHLKEHPNDAKALWSLYEAQAAMGEHSECAKVLLRLLGLGQDGSKIVMLLASHRGLSHLSPTERMKWAGRVDEDVRIVLFESVVSEPDDEAERPNALLALAEISDGPVRQKCLQELKEKYVLHSATVIARTRGMI